jgi:hypothetical protein
MSLKEISFFLLPGHHEVSRPTPPCASAMMCCATTGPKQQGQVTIDWNLLNCEPNNPFFFIILLFRVFCHSHGKLTNTGG